MKKSKDVKELFVASAGSLAEAIEKDDKLSKEKAVAYGVVGGLEYLAAKTDNEIDDKIISIIRKALPFAL